MSYPGGKGKMYQQIVNLLPKHSVYIEPFLGGASVLRAKAPAPQEFGVDKDPRVLRCPDLKARGVQLVNGDGIRFLMDFPFEGHEVVYCDPPYLPTTRRRARVYRHDASQEDHLQLLSVLKALTAKVVISGYANDLYDNELRTWNRHEFTAQSHSGQRTESLWFNFDKPASLHDYRYLGDTFRERQVIKRRLERIQARIDQLTFQEQAFLREWLDQRELINAA